MNPRQKMVQFKPLVEEPSYYSLSDGSVLMIRPSIIKVFQVLDPNGRPIVDATNNRVYAISAQNIVASLTQDEYSQIKRDKDR
jgi:hypothetical protein